MKNLGKMIAILILLASSTKLYAGDPIVGCPLGVEKGKFWLFTKTTFMNATEALWNEDSTQKPVMVSMPEGWHAKVSNMTVRMHLGVTERLTLGIVTNYINKDIKSEVWKKTPSGKMVRKWKEVKAHGFSDIWITGLYKIIHEHPFFEALSIGAAVRFDITDDPLVVKGIGSGSKAFRIAILSHMVLAKNLSGVTNLFYQKEGKIRNIMVKNENCQTVEWQKSGWKPGDSYGFKLGIEKAISPHLVGVAFLVGSWKKPSTDKDGNRIETTAQKDISLVTMLHYLPIGLEHEHSKFGLGLKTALLTKKSFSARFTPMVMAMWTF